MKIKILIIFVALFLTGAHAFSQKNDSADTTVVGEQVGDAADDTDDNATERADTTLTKMTFARPDDSINSYKRSKDFSYMQYLDSLLRKRTDLKTDTISANGGRSSRRQSSNSESETISDNNGSFFSIPGVKVFFWILAIVFIGFIIYKLFLSEGFFRKNSRPVAAAEEEEEPLEQSSYDPLISQALANKNFRLAIRYLYLQTLQKLSEAGVISFSVDKTNYEYVREISGRSYQNNFAALTLNYEYVWYGKFEIDDVVYQRLQSDFKTFQQKL